MTLTEFSQELSHVSAYLAAFATGLVGYGFVRLSIRGEGLVRHLATGLLLMHLAVFTRTLYWDGIRNFMDPELWARWSNFSGGTAVNVVFNTMVIFAGYHSLKALKLAIPEEDRDRFSLLGAAFYPRLRMIESMSSMLKKRQRRNGD
ncbi:hypothetical protein [Palleronia sp. LCG004]|uniref:hypothetical protein n=1 Tax=Palleronia sp. LCG004 TaxID=3079304 RepID=UPI0029435259|nr:hypothetical protein [Palleronia sp. LCG004]WOI58377.1 hypothetical protein RVY76_18515 [Palleronia sp. LCG004]